MADLLPSTPDLSAAREAEPRVIGVDSDAADDLLAALSSETARAILAALHDEPANPAALAERVGTSLQNAQYHLANMAEADLIEVVDTVYSEKGREMQVYAPADRPLVVYAGREEETTGLRAALSRLLGALAALALSSVVLQSLVGDGLRRLLGIGSPGGAGGGDGGATDTPAGQAGGYAAGDEASTTTTEAVAESATPTPVADGGTATEVATATPAGTGTPAPLTSTPTAAPEATAARTPTPATTTPAPTEMQSTMTEAATATATPAATPTPPPGAEAASTLTLQPGLAFFLGGATVLLVSFAIWYYRTR